MNWFLLNIILGVALIVVSVMYIVMRESFAVEVTRSRQRIKDLVGEKDHAESQAKEYRYAAFKLIRERDMLRDKLKRATAPVAAPASTTFTRDEFNSLLQLCHPDKHGGKESAVRMTQTLLSRRPN